MEKSETQPTTTQPPRTKKKLDPETNQLQISTRKNLNFFTFLSKIFLNKYEEVELHALGQAISICAKLAERLQRFDLADIQSIQTIPFTSEQREGDDRPPQKKVKMVIKVSRHAKFFDNVATEDL